MVSRSLSVLTTKQCDKSHDYEPTLKFKMDTPLHYITGRFLVNFRSVWYRCRDFSTIYNIDSADVVLMAFPDIDRKEITDVCEDTVF